MIRRKIGKIGSRLGLGRIRAKDNLKKLCRMGNESFFRSHRWQIASLADCFAGRSQSKTAGRRASPGLVW